jgi:hypothetical protein
VNLQRIGQTLCGHVMAGPLHKNWATMVAHGGGRPVSRCSKTDVKQPPQDHRGVG